MSQKKARPLVMPERFQKPTQKHEKTMVPDGHIDVSRLSAFYNDQERYLTKRQIGYCKRLIRWTNYDDPTLSCDRYLDYLRGLKLACYKTEARFIVEVFTYAGFRPSPFQVRAWLRYSRPAPKAKTLDIPKLVELRAFYHSLIGPERLAFYIMSSTGLRAADVSRLQLRSTLTWPLPQPITMHLPFSKNTNQLKLVTLSPATSELEEPELESLFRQHFSPGSVLGVNWARLRRLCQFRLHALRNRRAMLLIQRRHSREEVKDQLLWRDDRYLRLNQARIQECPDVDSAISLLRSYL